MADVSAALRHTVGDGGKDRVGATGTEFADTERDGTNDVLEPVPAQAMATIQQLTVELLLVVPRNAKMNPGVRSFQTAVHRVEPTTH